MLTWQGIGEQLKHPTGLAGRIMGRAMRIVNKTPNAKAVDALDIAPSDCVLELGFGPGQAISMMADKISKGRIYGIDASFEMLKQAELFNRNAIRQGRVKLKKADFYPLSFADGSIDKILAVNVIYFWTTAETILQECWRILCPGGKIAIYATDAASMKHWKFAGKDTHIHFSTSDIKRLLEAGGFDQSGIDIQTFKLAANINGILAVACKADTKI